MFSPNDKGTIHTSVKAPTTGAAMLLISAKIDRPARLGFIIQNVGSFDVYLGGSDVTASGATRGYLLKAGATTPTALATTLLNCDLYAIASGGTADLTIVDVY